MIKCKFGNFDGDSWEAFCQQCLILKFQNEGYQELYASNGDLGIEGFTRTGIVFQCYCPDDDYDPKTLYNKQRDKITHDLNKLIDPDRVKELKQYLHDIKIKQWIFLSPLIRRKDITEHCLNKRDEFRAKNIEYFDKEFDVLAYSEDYFTTEYATIKKANDEKIYIVSDNDYSSKTEWEKSNNDLVNNAIRKNRKRLGAKAEIEDRLNKLTDKTIKDYLDRDKILKEWKSICPHQYEKFEKIISDFERDVEELCMTNDDTNETLFKDVKQRLKAKITNNFSELSEATIDKLTNGVTADWILRCPLDFD